MGLFEVIYPWIISAIGGFVGAAALLPTKLGEAVIQYRVGKTLEAFKAQQARELESLRADLNHLGDRGRRSNEMEFQAIQTVWKAFVKAWLSTNTCIGQMMQIPDFNRMDDDEFDSFVISSDLNDSERKLLRSSSNRVEQYQSILSWRSVNEAGSDIYQARLTLREQRIFMPPITTQDFSEAIEQMSGAHIERRLSLENPRIAEYRFGKAQTKWMSDTREVFERIACSANKRLFKNEEAGSRLSN